MSKHYVYANYDSDQSMVNLMNKNPMIIEMSKSTWEKISKLENTFSDYLRMKQINYNEALGEEIIVGVLE